MRVAIRTLNGATTIINAGLVQSNVGTAINERQRQCFADPADRLDHHRHGEWRRAAPTPSRCKALAPRRIRSVNFQTLIMQGTAWNFTGTGTFANAALQSGTFNLTGTLGTATNVGVSAGATLNMRGVCQTFGNVTNAGTIVTSGTGPGTTLTSNNYVGDGGNLALNTFLGADNSPSDRLVINGGTATGSTSILINNVGGPGAQTTSNGIMVVNAINGATTAPGAFTLDNPELRAGALDYRLFHGGLNGSDPNDWFLRSTFLVPQIHQGPPGRSLYRCSRYRTVCHPILHRQCCLRRCGRSSGRSWPPMAWCNRSPGRWDCKRSAHYTNESVTH